MQDIRLQKLKTSLTDVIDKWIQYESCESNWDGLETHIGDRASELMADSAFNILLAQNDLSAYLNREGYLKEKE